MIQLLGICGAAWAFGFIGSVPLAGPIALMTLSRAAERRFDDARRVARGAALAEGIYASIAFWGFTTFLTRFALIRPICNAAAGMVLTGLGARFMFWNESEKPRTPDGHAATTLLGFSVSALNPTLLVTWSTAVAYLYSRGVDKPPASLAIPFGVCATAGVATWFECMVSLVRKYEGRWPRAAMQWVVRGMGLVLLGIGLVSCVEVAHWIRESRAPAGPNRPAAGEASPLPWTRA